MSELSEKHILIAGVGGVGGYVAENIARSGIKNITLLDSDNVAASNINRQIVALNSTVGKSKTKIMQQRIHDIDPSIHVSVINQFINSQNATDLFKSQSFDFVADCIDTIACKAQLIFEAQQKGIPIISAMGAGNRIDATRIRITPLDQTKGCPLAREIRRRLRSLGANLDYPVVFSDEPMRDPIAKARNSNDSFIEKSINGTISYMPAAIGILLAGEILKQLIQASEKK